MWRGLPASFLVSGFLAAEEIAEIDFREAFERADVVAPYGRDRIAFRSLVFG
jgi:hypothetical protein